MYIDGENFLFKAADVLKKSGTINHKPDITKFHFSALVESALNEYKVDEIRFYAAKLHLHRDTDALKKQSEKVIESQRKLKRSLMNDSVNFIISGHVRLQDTIPSKFGKPARYIFKEKGTDVQLAVDVLAGVCDGEVGTILLLSSDSDMQPVVKEVKKRGAKVVYIGFENVPNVGLSHNCHQTILLRKNEIIDAFEGRQKRLIQVKS